jgi:hypothetical protein
MGDLLGWDSATRVAERESYLRFAAAHKRAIQDAVAAVAADHVAAG